MALSRHGVFHKHNIIWTFKICNLKCSSSRIIFSFNLNKKTQVPTEQKLECFKMERPSDC